MSVSELISEKNHASWIASKKSAGINDRCYRWELMIDATAENCNWKQKSLCRHFECDKWSGGKKFEYKN